MFVPDLAPVNSTCALGGWLIACAWEERGERGREIEVTQMCGQVGGVGDGGGLGTGSGSGSESESGSKKYIQNEIK